MLKLKWPIFNKSGTWKFKFNKKILGKKAIALSRLVIWIIILLSFVMIAFTIDRLISKSEPLQAEIICRDSLALKAKTKIEVGPVEASSPSLCKTIDKKFETNNEDEALDWFSRSMERCWWIFLEGKVSEMFGPKGLLSLSAGKTKCFVCSTLSYKEGPTISKTKLIKHMNELSSRYDKGSVLDYIQKRGYINLYENVYPSDEAYALVFASDIRKKMMSDGTFYAILLATDVAFPIASPITRILGTEQIYEEAVPDIMHQNGLWMLKLNRFDKGQPCIYQPDVAGE